MTKIESGTGEILIPYGGNRGGGSEPHVASLEEASPASSSIPVRH
jgi:hypothetical protein